jgi:hypothetical protein
VVRVLGLNFSVRLEVVMTHAKLTAIAAVLWGGGFAATAALAYAVNRPLTAPPMPTSVEVMPPPAVLTELPRDPEPEPRLIVLPTVEIVGHVAPVAQAKPHHPRDISEMHCSAWKPLEQGSNSVQICD